MFILPLLLCLISGGTPDECNTTTSATTTTPPSPTPQGCSFAPHCHVFKNGTLVLFPGRKNVSRHDKISTFCNSFNGTIFLPQTEEDSQIWLEYTKMLYEEDNSFKEAFFPMSAYYKGSYPVYYLSSEYGTKRLTDADYKPPIDDDSDGQPDLDNFPFTDYDSEDFAHVCFAHVVPYYGQLEIRDCSKPIGVVICTAKEF